MQIINEICFLSVSVLYFSFTDFNPDPQIKVNCGWVMLLIVISNLIWPNLTFMLRGVFPDIIKACKKKKVKVTPKQSTMAFEKARLQFIKKNKMKLKMEFQPKEEKIDLFVPRKN